MTAREAREFAFAFTCHLLVKVVLRTVQFKTFLRLAAIRLPRAGRPLAISRVVRVVQLSRRLCRGSCLTESVVLKMFVRRHGYDPLPLTIGVTGTGDAFRAHAWTGPDVEGLVPLWTEEGQTKEGQWRA